MQEKALVAHLELHKKVVKNAWILSYEGRKVLVIEFQETVTEDESIAYIFALAKSLVSGKGSETLSPELMKMVKGTYVRILDEEMKRLIDNGIKMEGEMVKKLYEVRNRSGDLILENATSGEIREELHCTTAQVNNARTSGDHIFGEYKVEEIDRKLSRKTDFDLLREFESVCDQLLGSRKGKK